MTEKRTHSSAESVRVCTRDDLRRLVDAVWLHATEATHYPSTKTADMLISAASLTPDVAQSVQVTDAMVEAGAIGLMQDVAEHDEGPSFYDASEQSRSEAKAMSRACLTAALAPQPSPAATVETKSAPVLIASHQSEGLPSSDAAGAGADTHSSAATEHASWDDANYQRARDTMVDILRRNSGWSITTGDLTAFDNAFQHAVGILSLTAQHLPNEPQAVNECPEYLDDATDWVPLREAPVVTDADVERAWAAMVGNDVASMCHQASVVRGDIRTALQSYALSRPEHLSPSASSPAGPAPSQRPSE